MQYKGGDGCHYHWMDFVPIMRGNHIEQIDTASNTFILGLYILTGQFTYKKAKQEVVGKKQLCRQWETTIIKSTTYFLFC